MARISCPECKRQISETSDSCPKCGYKLDREKVVKAKKKRQGVQMLCVIVIALGFCVAFMIIWGVIQNSSKTPSSYQKTLSPYQDSLEAKRHLVNCPSIYKTEVSCPHVDYRRDVEDYKYYWKFPKGDPRRLKNFDSEITKINSTTQKSPTPRQSERLTTSRQQIGQEKPEITRYKVQYRSARREYETAQSNYNQNPSASNKQAWDDAANKLDRAYLRLEKAMGAEPHKGVTKQRKELEAFTRLVKSEAK